ncbi:MAG: archaeal heat shock protein Hsp20, partial [Methanosarcinales archaeon]
DDIFKDFEEMIDNLFEDIEDEIKGPFVYGFSLTHRPGEEPEIREFGNVRPRFGRPIEISEITPLVEVFKSDDKIHVVADMPGVEREDISLDCSETSLEIYASHGDKKYSKHVELPSKVDPNSATATYKNGVLEVILKRTKSTRIPIKVK